MAASICRFSSIFSMSDRQTLTPKLDQAQKFPASNFIIFLMVQKYVTIESRTVFIHQMIFKNNFFHEVEKLRSEIILKSYIEMKTSWDG